MSIMNRLEEIIKNNQFDGPMKENFTQAEVEELLALADENGCLEVDGKTVQVLKGSCDELLEALSSLGGCDGKCEHCGSEHSEEQTEAKIEELVEKTSSLVNFLTENNFTVEDLLLSASCIVHSHCEETREQCDLTSEEYSEYTKDVARDMAIYYSTFGYYPVRNTSDFASIGLQLATLPIGPERSEMRSLVITSELMSNACEDVKEDLRKRYNDLLETAYSDETAEQLSRSVASQMLSSLQLEKETDEEAC